MTLTDTLLSYVRNWTVACARHVVRIVLTVFRSFFVCMLCQDQAMTATTFIAS